MSDERKVPTGRLARLANMARVGVRTGLNVWSGGEGTAAAEQAAALLGNLRGLAAKVGQMASYVDGLIPEPQRAAYERVLSSLQSATAASPFAKVRALLEAELDCSLERTFANFEPSPMASASASSTLTRTRATFCFTPMVALPSSTSVVSRCSRRISSRARGTCTHVRSRAMSWAFCARLRW